jgi:hypothetical protein
VRTKGQLISKCLFGVIVLTNIPTKNLTISALAHNLGARAEIVKFFRWYFGRNDDTQDILKLTDLYTAGMSLIRPSFSFK